MRSGLKLAFITIPIVAAGAGFLAYMVATNPPPERKDLAERATPVRVIVARNQPVSPTITGFGLVSPARTYALIPQVQGIAEYVNPRLQKGEILPAGALLLRISPADYNLEIAQAHANIRSADARLAELSVSEDNLMATLAIETETLELLTRDYDRVFELSNSGTVSASALDTKRASLLSQKQKVQNVDNSIALLPTQRAVQEEQIAVYQANLETAKLKLERTKIFLPFAARVSSSSLEVGEHVRVALVAAEFDGVDAAEINTQVSADDLLGTLFVADRSNNRDGEVVVARLTESLRGFELTATVRLKIGPQVLEWPATVERISDTIDQKAGTIGLIVRVDSAYSSAQPGKRPPLTKGMFVEVLLSAKPVTGIVVPRSALRDGRVLIAGDDDRLKLVPVTPLLIQGAIAVIGDGLKDAQRVVVSDLSPVMPGMLLQVTQDDALMERLIGEGKLK